MFARCVPAVVVLCGNVSFCSTEAFADYLCSPVAMHTLAADPSLNMNKKQQGMIGTERYKESIHAQLTARGLGVSNEATSAATSAASGMPYFTSEKHADPSLGAQMWAKAAVKLVMASTRKTGNHGCRPDVCHKGSVGKKGFCLMGSWHWARATDREGKVSAKRTHGLELQPRWNSSEVPPLHNSPPWLGSPKLEATHPFHF